MTDIKLRVEVLTYFTKQALIDDEMKAIKAFNTEQVLMKKAVLQNGMTLDLTAAREGTCAIIKAECLYIFLISLIM